MEREQELAENYHKLLPTLGSSKLIAVTKRFPANDIQTLVSMGHEHFGENRLEELVEKSELLKDQKIHWHFIGRLQTNKVKSLLKIKQLYAIHSVDSIKLFDKLITEANKLNIPNCIGFFLQVNTSNEAEKGGVSIDDFSKFYQYVIENITPNFKLLGLMTMGNIRGENLIQDARICFEKLVDLRDSLDKNLELSMGMSSDYPIAVELESNWVRVGQKIMGKRS